MDKTKFNDRKEWRKFAFGLSAILFIISTIQFFLDSPLYPFLLSLCLLVLITGLAAPILIKPIFIFFSYVGFVMGWFMTRVILSLIFYFVFTPIGIIACIFGKDFLDKKFDKSPSSYWIKSKSDNKNYEKMY